MPSEQPLVHYASATFWAGDPHGAGFAGFAGFAVTIRWEKCEGYRMMCKQSPAQAQDVSVFLTASTKLAATGWLRAFQKILWIPIKRRLEAWPEQRRRTAAAIRLVWWQKYRIVKEWRQVFFIFQARRHEPFASSITTFKHLHTLYILLFRVYRAHFELSRKFNAKHTFKAC